LGGVILSGRLAINVRTAKALGITLPPEVQAIARPGNRIKLGELCSHMSQSGPRTSISRNATNTAAIGGIAAEVPVIEIPKVRRRSRRYLWLSLVFHP
jgi:hypothetical protein